MSVSLHRLLLAIPLALSAPALGAQNPSAALPAEARAQLSANRFDSAATLLDAALATAPYPADSFTVLIWRGVLEYVRGHDDLTREWFRQALRHPPTDHFCSILIARSSCERIG